MKRVLVTGAAGFIGRPACRWLREAGWEIVGTGRRDEAPKELAGMEWISADLLAAGAAEKIAHQAKASQLLHLAWVTEHGKYWESPTNPAWISASQSLIGAFAKAGGQRVVVAGTCAEYDWSAPDPVSAPPKPATLYGKSKLALHDWAEKFAAEAGLALAWGRVFFTFGPGEDERRLIPYVMRQCLLGQPALCGSGQAERDFLFVDDLALQFVQLLVAGETGDFDLGSGHGVKLREVVKTIARLAGRPELPRLGARPDPAGEPQCLVAKVKKIRQIMGSDFRPDLEQSLRGQLEWWKRTLTAESPQ